MTTLQLLFAFLSWSLATSSSHSLPSPDDFLVHGLDRIEPAYAQFDGRMYAGLLPMNNHKNRTGELYFWFFVPTKPAVSDSLTIWLNGGPGCSSINGGVLFEHSPVTVPLHPAGYCCASANEPLQYNEYAWTQATHMLYVEQVRSCVCVGSECGRLMCVAGTLLQEPIRRGLTHNLSLIHSFIRFFPTCHQSACRSRLLAWRPSSHE
jgi:hypothetical protein